MFLYRLILTLSMPVVFFRLWLRETSRDRQQRLGNAAHGDLRSPIWLHAASNGELASARGLIERLSQRSSVLITCNTTTARALAESWDLPNVAAQLAPMDFRWSVARFLRSVKPAAIIVIENEIWPNRIIAMAKAQKPAIVLSARLSETSARNWRLMPGLARRLLSAISLLSAQDSLSEERFCALGLSADKIYPVLNLKKTISRATPNAGDLQSLRAVFDRSKTILAASTHDGEEVVILDAFAKALNNDPALRLILAPRHPRRRAALVQLLEERKLQFAARSSIPRPAAETQVYLADTFGEMPLWYCLAGTAFIGGSLVPKGGHTPYEPAAFNCALLHGPHLDNFRDAYSALQAADASRLVRASTELAAQFEMPPDTQRQLGDAANHILSDKTAPEALDNLVAQITLKLELRD